MTKSALAVLAGLCAVSVSRVDAQGELAPTYRLRVSEEMTVDNWRGSWTAANLFTAAGESTLNWKDRLQLGASMGVEMRSRDVSVHTREAYARWSALPWLDLEGGRRIIRWGVGYAFTPTGVLDPPRSATDPQDRLGLNEGVLVAKADLYAGPASVTVVASERVHAARVRTTVRGVEFALVAAVDAGRAPAWGANLTHVIGDRFEVHGEILSQQIDPARPRALSTLIGGQYTFAAGPNVVLEYYRAAGRDFAFVRVSRGPGDMLLSPEALLLVDLDARTYSIVPSLSLGVADHVHAYVRGVIDAARRAGSLTTGLTLRF